MQTKPSTLADRRAGGASVNAEQAEYDRRWAAEHYGGSGEAGYTANFLAFMRESLPSSGRALEVGCGAGEFTGAMAKLGLNATGVDLSPVGVEKARDRFPDCDFLVHDLAEAPLPFDGATVDATWCSEVLEHLFSPLAAVRDIHRVLKPGGVAAFTVPYHGLVKNVAIALFAFDKHYDPEYPHIQFFTRKLLKRIVEKAGLVVEEVRTCGSNLGLRDWVLPTNLLLRARKPGDAS